MSWWIAFILTLFSFEKVLLHHQSNDVVFYIRSSHRSARQLAEEHGLRYISEVFPGSNYHHAEIRNELLDPNDRVLKMSADPRVTI